MKLLFLYTFVITFQTCISYSKPVNNPEPVYTPTVVYNQDKFEKAYFAAGCFWCVELVFESVKGVEEVYSGYSGGDTENPNYYQIGSGRTNHAEAVEVIYDPNVVSYKELVIAFFGSHDPTTPNQQGPDKGSQYRSIAFYENKMQQKVLEDYVSKLVAEKIYPAKIVTEIVPFKKFYYAEEYHQDYEKKNPYNPYVQNVSIPRFKRFKNKHPELLKETID